MKKKLRKKSKIKISIEYTMTTRTIRFNKAGWARVRKGRKPRPYRGRYSSLAAKIKRISLQQCETKKSMMRYAAGTDAQPLFHNISDYWGNLFQTTQGVTDPQGNALARNNRIGTDIIVRGLKLKFMFISTTDRPNLNIMVYVFKYNVRDGEGGGMSDATFWAGPVGQGGTSNRFLDHANTDRVTVLRKFVVQNRNNYNISDSGSNRVHTVYRDLYINFKNMKVRYDNDLLAGQYPMWKDIGVCVTAFDATNSGAADIVGYWTGSSCLYFKDP